MLIPWLKTVRKMDVVGSRNGEWKFGKNPIYNCRAHIATSFVPAAIVIPEQSQRSLSDSESTGHPFAGELQVSALNILHSYRFQNFGQGRYGG
jgi:hypothetical protein